MGQAWYLVEEYGFLAACFLALGLGPPAALLWTWRRWGSRQGRAVRAALLPVAIFVLAGAAGATVALVEVAAFSRPGRLGIFPPYGAGPTEHVARCYWVAGTRGVLAAGLLALAWAPAALGWRWLHPSSFRRVTGPAARGALSFAEQDYGDRVAAEPHYGLIDCSENPR
jgi:hypothetical protein